MLTNPALYSAFSSPAVSCPNTSLEPKDPKLSSFIDYSKNHSFSTKESHWPFVRDKTTSPKQASKSVMSSFDPEEDLRKLTDNEAKLKQSGYYHGSLTWKEASQLLNRTKTGTFLVRDSEHCCYLYTLSVQTLCGPTSCRIEYENGFFRLDTSGTLSDKVPRFDSVPDLIDHHVQLTMNWLYKSGTTNVKFVWLNMNEENEHDIPIQIHRPLYTNVRSLKHMSRVVVMKLQQDRLNASQLLRTSCKNKLCDILPPSLSDYLNEYPHGQ